MGADQVPFTSLGDVILSEVLPLFEKSATSATFRLDAYETVGLVLAYRGMEFLFAQQDSLVTSDFVVYRPASGDLRAGWPDVESPAGIK